jgi:hypothetical protein
LAKSANHGATGKRYVPFATLMAWALLAWAYGVSAESLVYVEDFDGSHL